MKNLQRIILWKCYLAVFFLASPAYLQAQIIHTGDLTITVDGDVPSNETTLTRITGNLTIDGTITSFPNFAALAVVEGNLTIDNITTSSLTTLTDIFPALDTIRGNLLIQNNTVIQTITGFTVLDSIGGYLSINDNTLLSSLSGFDAFTSIGGSLNIGRFDPFKLTELVNPALTTLPDFGGAHDYWRYALDCWKWFAEDCFGFFGAPDHWERSQDAK